MAPNVCAWMLASARFRRWQLYRSPRKKLAPHHQHHTAGAQLAAAPQQLAGPLLHPSCTTRREQWAQTMVGAKGLPQRPRAEATAAPARLAAPPCPPRGRTAAHPQAWIPTRCQRPERTATCGRPRSSRCGRGGPAGFVAAPRAVQCMRPASAPSPHPHLTLPPPPNNKVVLNIEHMSDRTSFWLLFQFSCSLAAATAMLVWESVEKFTEPTSEVRQLPLSSISPPACCWRPGAANIAEWLGACRCRLMLLTPAPRRPPPFTWCAVPAQRRAADRQRVHRQRVRGGAAGRRPAPAVAHLPRCAAGAGGRLPQQHAGRLGSPAGPVLPIRLPAAAAAGVHARAPSPLAWLRSEQGGPGVERSAQAHRGPVRR